MCELFAMSSDRPARLQYELTRFSTHGGQRYANRDGWGISFVQDRDAYLYREPSAAAASPLELLVAGQSVPSRLVVAHVRRASRGNAALCNTHPFRRTTGGAVCHFAHNGDLPGLQDLYHGTETSRHCVGDTDSELAFMLLLEQLSRLPDAASAAERFRAFGEFCAAMRAFGDANFLYTEGEALFVHAHKRRYEENGIVSDPRPPGLHFMQLDAGAREWRVKGAHLACEGESHILVASVPLDDGPWVGLPEGSTLLVERGRIAARIDGV